MANSPLARALPMPSAIQGALQQQDGATTFLCPACTTKLRVPAHVHAFTCPTCSTDFASAPSASSKKSSSKTAAAAHAPPGPSTRRALSTHSSSSATITSKDNRHHHHHHGQGGSSSHAAIALATAATAQEEPHKSTADQRGQDQTRSKVNLQQAIKTFRRATSGASVIGPSSGRDVVRLNVGGALFMTTTDTLRHAPRGSFFNTMFATNEFRSLEGDDGFIFIDRDGSTFHHVLTFLRDNHVNLPAAHIPVLLQEAQFYGIKQLAHECIRLQQIRVQGARELKLQEIERLMKGLAKFCAIEM